MAKKIYRSDFSGAFHFIRHTLFALGLAIFFANPDRRPLAVTLMLVGAPYNLPFRLLRRLARRSQSPAASAAAQSSEGPRGVRPALSSRKVHDFVAIDFETANANFYSACALGVVKFHNGAPVDRKYWLINPGVKFAKENIAIHGITPDQVANAPKFPDLWPHVLSLLRHYRIVAYSDFDFKVIKSLVKHYSLQAKGTLNVDYFDVCQCARDSILGLTNYKLPTVAKYLGVTGLQHHNALSDAEVCGLIYAWLAASRKHLPAVASKDEPASYAQQDYIRALGGEVPPVLSKVDASPLIDSLIEKRNAERQAQYEAERDARQRDKEQSELAHVAAAMSDPDYKPRKRRSRRLQDLSDFQHLLNNVFADDFIEPAEAENIMHWLQSRKVEDSDFAGALSLLPRIIDGSATPDMAETVYASLLDCLRELRARPTV